MKVLGLITEYNPFHNGHKYHLNKAKSMTSTTHTIAVMSGHFLQRGEPAIFDKWTRAEIAIKEGVDLVIELPTVYSCNSAEFFAYGSVKLLDQLNIVDYLCFGSEAGEIEKLLSIAKILVEEPSSFKKSFKNYIKLGLSFPLARQKALEKYLINNLNLHTILSNPNNILGIEYLKALIAIDSKIKPLTIKRIKADYNSKEIKSDICSATAIRELLLNDEKNVYEKLYQVVPDNSYRVIMKSIKEGNGPIFTRDIENFLLYKLRTIDKATLKKIHDVREGLENRIIEAALNSTTYMELVNNIKSKRYTLTSIQRILVKSLIDIFDIDIVNNNIKAPQYIRVLGFSDKGRELLRLIKEKSNTPIITNLKYYKPQNHAAEKMINTDIKATNVYALFHKKPSLKYGLNDYTKGPYIHINT